VTRSSRLVAQNKRCPWFLRCVPRAFVAAIVTLPCALSGTTNADDRQYAVVARVDAKSETLTLKDVVIKVGSVSVRATAIKASPETPLNVAIVVDAGPDQGGVLSREKALAVALINQLSDAGTIFTIARAAISPQKEEPTLDRRLAIEYIRDLAGDRGGNQNIAVYDALGSAIRQISLSPGLRAIIFIGEGNDGGSNLRYAELRSLAESNHVACFAVLITDHSLRGTKSILRYGWNLRELAGDTTGIFLENPKTPNATRRLSENVRRLRLIAFEIPFHPSGRYKISVSSLRGKRLLAQKSILIP
jgi:hypothetical protein